MRLKVKIHQGPAAVYHQLRALEENTIRDGQSSDENKIKDFIKEFGSWNYADSELLFPELKKEKS
jgi:hypothetical protein